ncbi:uncharacterized membrane protein (DUF485 family) [Sphingomonas sp. UYAg733]
MFRIALFLALLLAACGYAARRGGGPERLTAYAFLVAYILTIVVRSYKPERYLNIETGVFVVDALLFVTVLVIMLRANRVWPIWMSALLLMAVGGHIAKLLDPRVIRTAYQIMLSLWGWPAAILLIVATWLHQRRLTLLGVDASWKGSSPADPLLARPLPRPPPR